jgi:hypothetical protein
LVEQLVSGSTLKKQLAIVVLRRSIPPELYQDVITIVVKSDSDPEVRKTALEQARTLRDAAPDVAQAIIAAAADSSRPTERADSIMRDGFRDKATVNKRLFSGTTTYPPGVWFGDVPAIDDELFDGIGLFNFDAERQTFIAVDVPVGADDGIQSSACDSSWPGTQYWGPASIWNRFPRTRFHLDDIIRLRLPDFPEMRNWVNRERDYATEFYARVKRVLADRS